MFIVKDVYYSGCYMRPPKEEPAACHIYKYVMQCSIIAKINTHK